MITKFKAFENDHSDIDPYNEEEWGIGKNEYYDKFVDILNKNGYKENGFNNYSVIKNKKEYNVIIKKSLIIFGGGREVSLSHNAGWNEIDLLKFEDYSFDEILNKLIDLKFIENF